MATLHFSLSIDGLEDESLVVRGFEGRETLSDSYFQGSPCYGFRYHIDLASRKERIMPEQVVDLNAELRIYRNGECVQRVHGIVREFTQGDIGHHHTYYSLTLVPALERLSLRHNSRIFQQKTTMDIVTILLEEMGIDTFAFALRQNNSQPREFCVQYRETDLAFLHRLIAEEGWVYSFEHLAGKHTLLFSNHSTVLPVLDSPVIYNNLSGGVAKEPYISAFSKQTRTETAKVELKDYSFKKPSYHFLHNQYASDIGYQRDRYEYYDYPGRYKKDENGKTFSRIRLEYLRRAAELATGTSNQPLMRSGYRFEMVDHANPEMNRKWVIVSVTHTGTQPQALQEEGTQGATTYSNTFEVIPSSLSHNWRATPQPKPRVDGPMIATVVGPEGEEIFCDQYGRVKVHFPWDRYSDSNEESSCWVRVSQGWAGSQHGMVAIPRIGHEVIVSFLNGDPDQPIITGRTYHAGNIPPYPLPENKTKTVLRSETHQGSGFNEFSFEDQAGAEKVYLYAQKDFEADVRNDHTTHIRQDKHMVVENDAFTHIKGHQHVTIEGEQREKISADKTVIAEGALQQKVANKTALEAGNEVHLKAGNKVVLDAGAEITIQAGGSFVKVDPAGVHLVGPAINLNSGGRAAKGSGFSGRNAALPNGVAAVQEPDTTMSQSLVSRQIKALKTQDPLCEICEEEQE